MHGTSSQNTTNSNTTLANRFEADVKVIPLFQLVQLLDQMCREIDLIITQYKKDTYKVSGTFCTWRHIRQFGYKTTTLGTHWPVNCGELFLLPG